MKTIPEQPRHKHHYRITPSIYLSVQDSQRNTKDWALSDSYVDDLMADKKISTHNEILINCPTTTVTDTSKRLRWSCPQLLYSAFQLALRTTLLFYTLLILYSITFSLQGASAVITGPLAYLVTSTQALIIHSDSVLNRSANTFKSLLVLPEPTLFLADTLKSQIILTKKLLLIATQQIISSQKSAGTQISLNTLASAVKPARTLISLEPRTERVSEAFLTQRAVINSAMLQRASVYFPSIKHSIEAQITSIERNDNDLNFAASTYICGDKGAKNSKFTLLFRSVDMPEIHKHYPAGLPCVVTFSKISVSVLKGAVHNFKIKSGITMTPSTDTLYHM